MGFISYSVVCGQPYSYFWTDYNALSHLWNQQGI